MALTENLIERLAVDVCGSKTIVSAGEELNLAAPYTRLNMAEAVADKAGLSPDEALVREQLDKVADRLDIDPAKRTPGLGLLCDLFEALVEGDLRQPTFVTGFPVEVSPLARQSSADPRFVDRFELIATGREIANGFSELNDPEEQRRRFAEQFERRQAGDLEAHMMDDDYIRALEYGLPPTGGAGIGVDRLVMILTGCSSIRDVLLFPQLKPESRG
jgi:lysyl-tRNA synthetase class 2